MSATSQTASLIHQPRGYTYKFVNWHLVKKDPQAAISSQLNHHLVVGGQTHKFRDMITAAALSWNIAFEKAGVSNAIVVKQQPDDAEWDAGDIRYNVLR